MPNRIIVKIKLAPRNLHFDNIYPFSDPKNEERIVATTTIYRLLLRLGASFSNAAMKSSSFLTAY